eukprot:m.291178 g.291178  ORF g.291178 m.291178 type:complete len:515 (-) comp12428_c0_seq1:41-1585(-)
MGLLLAWSAHSDELLGSRGVDGNAVVKVALGCAHLHGDSKALENLVDAHTNHVQANNTLLRTGTDDLHRRLDLVLSHGVVHVGKGGLVDLEVVLTKLLSGLLFAVTTGANGRVAENDRGNHVPVLLELRLGLKEAVGELAADRNGNGSELDVATNVAESIDAINVRVLELVDLDVAILELDPRGFQANVRVGASTNGKENTVVVLKLDLFAALLGADNNVFAVLAQSRDVCVFDNLNASAGHLSKQLRADCLVEAAKDLLSADHELDVAAKGIEDARHLDGNVASANDSAALGQLLELEKAVAGDAQLLARDAGPGRTAAGGNDNVLCPVRVASDLDGVGRSKLGKTLNLLNAALAEVGLVDAVQALDVGIALRLEGGKVKRAALSVKAVLGVVANHVSVHGCVEHDLLWHAANVDTGATHAAHLNDSSLDAKLGRATSHANAARATTNHKKIKHLCRSHCACSDVESPRVTSALCGVRSVVVALTPPASHNARHDTAQAPNHRQHCCAGCPEH